uniref:Uncharacterized protein n=1 Tax=Magallana gigas TaxID=29159 RepID=K1QG01_MAGGI
MIWCLLVLKDTAVVNGIGGSTLNPSYETTTEHLIGIIEEATFSTDSVTFASITDRSFTTDPVKNTDNEVHSKETTFSTDSVTFGPSTDRSFTTGSVEKPTTPEPDSDPEFVYAPNTGGGDSSSLDCTCNCNNGVSHPTLTEDEVEIVVSEIRKNLTVLKANLSSNIRKRISASDPRLSSRVIGMTLGVSILSFVASLLVIPDLVAGFRCLMSML